MSESDKPRQRRRGHSDVSVSVVVPCFDAAITIERQIAALANQTWSGPLEVVVSDNGSHDEGPDVARRAADGLGLKLSVVDSSDRRGVSHARNVGVAAATGDVILICDADDVVTDTWVDRMVHALFEADLVGGVCAYEQLNSARVIAMQGGGQSKGVHVGLGYLPYAVGANFGAWRDVIEAIGGWQMHYVGGGDDVDFSWRAQLAGFRLAPADDAVVHYRLREGLREGMRQRARKAQMGVLLFSEYKSHMSRPRRLRGLRTAAWLLRATPQLSDPVMRHRWCLVAAGLFGRVKGSIRYRTLYL